MNMNGGFLGQDWSLGGFGNKVGGLLSDPQQQMALTQNPLFNVGMGLLSAGRDASIDPFQAALGGLLQAQQQAQASGDRKRLEELREKMAALISGMQGQTTPQSMPMTPDGMPQNNQTGEMMRRLMWEDVINGQMG